MKNAHAYIFVHDQDIIDAYESTRKLEKVFGKNYTYVFVGQKNVNQYEKTIICRTLTDNIEQYPKLVTFTGWYALVKNGFITHDYNFMLEYDILLSPKFDKIVSDMVKKTQKTTGMWSFIPVPKDFLFYEYMNSFFEKICVEDFRSRREQFIADGGNEKWCGSSNSLWYKQDLISFVDWFYRCLNDEDLWNDPTIGHIVERAITAWCVFTNTKYKFITGVLQHAYLDSHQTQAVHNNGVQKDYRQHIQELARR